MLGVAENVMMQILSNLDLKRVLFRDGRLLDCDVVLGFDEKGELVSLWRLERIIRGGLLKTL